MNETIDDILGSSLTEGSGKNGNKSKLDDFIKKYNEASSETKKEIKSRLEADAAFGSFIKNFRKSNLDTQQKIVERLANSSDSTAGKFVDALRNALSPKQKELPYDVVKIKEDELPYDVVEINDEELPHETVKITEPDNAAEAVEYTYKPGDTFGRVLMKIGLSDGKNLWGPNGDVAYYTEQLHNQGIYGNIPIGTTIKLIPRGAAAKSSSSVNASSGYQVDPATGKLVSTAGNA